MGHKQQRRWLCYAWHPHLKIVLAYEFGARADDILKRLLALLSVFKIWFYCTDGWENYQCHLPAELLITKRYTQSIKRQNLNFRPRIKRLAHKTLCFSKSLEIHDKVIGAGSALDVLKEYIKISENPP